MSMPIWASKSMVGCSMLPFGSPSVKFMGLLRYRFWVGEREVVILNAAVITPISVRIRIGIFGVA